MPTHTIEVNVRGKWTPTKALEVKGKNLLVEGKFLKIASIHDEVWLDTEIDDPEACMQALRSEMPADVFTFMEKVPSESPRYPYPMEIESFAAVRITTFEEWWEGLPQETRKNVRRSQKRGVTVDVRELTSEVIQGIIAINDESPVKQGRPSRYFGKSFEETKKDHGAFLDRSDFICAYFGEELVGLLKLVHRGEISTILGYLPKASHYDKRPANALIAKAVEVSVNRGSTYLIYGNYNYGNKGDSSLREFKVRNGFSEVFIPRYYVPLTLWGKLCMKGKLHKGLLGILPHSVITTAVGLRTKCYTWLNRASSSLQSPAGSRSQ
ncbi:MAG: hypothetical protein ABIR70_14505 [Bryobacteraceae bacterium]